MNTTAQRDAHWMGLALEQARLAQAADEVPIGAVVVLDGAQVAAGYNCPIGSVDPTAHAEVVALRAAAKRVGNYRLIGAQLYVTVEPCAMCVGALVHARIDRLVFGAREPKTGAVVSTNQLLQQRDLKNTVDWVEGVCADEAAALLQRFFRDRRNM